MRAGRGVECCSHVNTGLWLRTVTSPTRAVAVVGAREVSPRERRGGGGRTGGVDLAAVVAAVVLVVVVVVVSMHKRLTW